MFLLRFPLLGGFAISVSSLITACPRCAATAARTLRWRHLAGTTRIRSRCIFLHRSCRFLRFTLLVFLFLTCFRSLHSFCSRSVMVFFHASHRCICLRGALQLRRLRPLSVCACLAVPRINDVHPEHLAAKPNSSKFSRDMYTRFGTGTCSSVSNFFLCSLSITTTSRPFASCFDPTSP